MPEEVERMIAAVRKGKGRLVKRDVLLIMLGSSHGLRTSELAELRWSEVNLDEQLLIVRRKKQGVSSTHLLSDAEVRQLRAWWSNQPKDAPHVFTSLRGSPMARFTIHRAIANAGKAAGLEFPCHLYMLRRTAVYYWATQGKNAHDIQSWLGLRHIPRYCKLAPDTPRRSGFGPQPDDESLLPLIREIVSKHASYGHRRITVLLNRQLEAHGRARINHKRIYRIMRMEGVAKKLYQGNTINRKTPENT
jgi:type 1 fimbriae regulatory protein FimB